MNRFGRYACGVAALGAVFFAGERVGEFAGERVGEYRREPVTARVEYSKEWPEYPPVLEIKHRSGDVTVLEGKEPVDADDVSLGRDFTTKGTRILFK